MDPSSDPSPPPEPPMPPFPPNLHPPALRRHSSGARRNSHVVWDEQNLQENEKIQAAFSGIKVPEPKTPYHGPVPEGWEDEMKPLHLDDHGGNQGGNSGGVSAFDLCYDNGAGGNGECDILVLGEGSAPSSSSIHQEGATAEGMVVLPSPSGTKRTGSECSSFGSFTSSDGEGGPNSDKRRRFEQHRKAHYNMKHALAKAKTLLNTDTPDMQNGGVHHDDHEDDDDDDDDLAHHGADVDVDAADVDDDEDGVTTSRRQQSSASMPGQQQYQQQHGKHHHS
eukprot:jgi/Chrzof1/6317/Cz18g04020.t1